MGRNYRREIAQAKMIRESADLTLFDGYLGIMRERFKALDPVKKLELLNGLETLVGEVGLAELRPAPQKPIVKTILEEEFDPKKATSIRSKLGISRADLVKQLGEDTKSGLYRAVMAYENGRNMPADHTGKTSMKYLRWLKGQGYNPYKV